MRQTWVYSAEEFGKRMEAVRGERTQEAFATELGLHKNTLRNYELGERQPDSELIARFCQHTGVLPEWLLFGERQQFASQRDEVERLTVRYAPPDQMLEDYVLVPRFESPYRIVEGHLVRDDEVVSQVAFRKSWVLGTMGLLPDKLAAVSVLGDSMAPTINQGDILLLDMKQNALSEDAVYALNYDGRLSIKRVQLLPQGGAVLRSDNRLYSEVSVAAADLGKLPVVGRVVWMGRQL